MCRSANVENLFASCVGKEPFAKPQRAHRIVKRMERGGRPGVVYRCRHCNRWHIGTRGPSRQRATKH